MDEWIELADGTQVEDTHIVKLTNEEIMIYANSISDFATVYSLFGDAEKTARIHSYQYGDEEYWEGFTQPFSMTVSEGKARIGLQRG